LIRKGDRTMPPTKVGQRNTRQRETILSVIRAAQGPLTVDEIHRRAKRRVRGMGIATVYRTVKLLLEHEELQTVVLPDGQSRYESAHLKHHHHFRCRRCDQVYDLSGCMLPIAAGTTLPQGFIVEDHEVTLYGICPKCGDGT
jgi:Fur family ferric uptake transcriptional regulator